LRALAQVVGMGVGRLSAMDTNTGTWRSRRRSSPSCEASMRTVNELVPGVATIRWNSSISPSRLGRWKSHSTRTVGIPKWRP
jgi:hypothetical protein